VAAVTHPDLVAGTDTPVAAVTDTALSPVTVVITSVPWVICPDIVLSHKDLGITPRHREVYRHQQKRTIDINTLNTLTITTTDPRTLKYISHTEVRIRKKTVF